MNSNQWDDAVRGMWAEEDYTRLTGQINENRKFSQDFDKLFNANSQERKNQATQLARVRLKVADRVLANGGMLPPDEVSVFNNALKNLGVQADFKGAVVQNVGGKQYIRTLIGGQNGKAIVDPSAMSFEDLAAYNTKLPGILSDGSRSAVDDYINKNYTRRQQIEAGIINPDQELMADRIMMNGDKNGGRLISTSEGRSDVSNSINKNITTGKSVDSGAKPGPRNSRSTISVYSNLDGGMTRTVNGHTGEDTGYVSLRTDEEKADANAERLAKVASAKSSSADKLAIAAMKERGLSERAEADRLSKEKRAQAYADERKALREQNSILSRMRMLGSQRDKELDPKKKEEIQKQINELEKGLRDVPDPDAEEKSGTNTLSTAGSATGAVVGRKNPVIPSSGGASKEVKDDAESKRRATNGKAGNARIATGEQVGNDQDANTVSDNNDSSFTEDEINAKIKEIRNTTNKKNVTREEAIEELESDKQFNESVKASAKKVGKKVGRALHSAVMYAGDYLTGQNKKDAPYPDFLKDDDTVRNDGTKKGNGYLGILKLPNGKDATEYSVGVKIDGKEIDIPTLVPTLTKEEVSQMVNDIIPNNKSVPDSIMNKAISHAKKRIASGKSVFAESGEYDKNKS